MTLFEELTWRGLIQDAIPETDKLLENNNVKAYVGFDPTSDSLHIGSLVPILLLVHLQKNGHTPYALIGGATGMVGDPSGKSEERNMLSLDELKKNQEGVFHQLSKFLNFDSSISNPAKIVNNYDWFQQISFLDFIRDVGKHISVNYMMAKDSVQNRLKNGMSFTEFSYQLVQGYDFYHLYKNEGVELQMGGSDQWGNIVTGTELIRRKLGESAFAFTAPLLKKSDGGKFGKTESGNIWLDKEKTSPYKFYQFWLNAADEDAKNYIKFFTFLAPNEIDELIKNHDEAPHLRALQKKLAEELTSWVHSLEDLESAQKATEILFGKSTNEDVLKLNEKELLEIMDGVPQSFITKTKILEGINIIDLLVQTNVFSSNGEARKMIQNGGLSINKVKMDAAQEIINTSFLIKEKYILIQKGKKNYYLIIAQ